MALAALVALPACSLFVSLDDLSGGDAALAPDAASDVVVVSEGGADVGTIDAGDAGDEIAPSAPPVFRAVTQTSSGSPAGSLTINRPVQVVTGDFMLMIVYEYVYGNTTAPPDGSWTFLFKVDDPSPSYEVFYYWKIAGPSESASYTFSITSGSYSSLTLVAYSGTSKTPVVASSTNTVENASLYVAPPITGVSADTLTLFTAVADGQQSSNWKANGGLTLRSGTGGIFVGDAVPGLADGGADAGTISATNSNNGTSGGIAVFAIAPP